MSAESIQVSVKAKYIPYRSREEKNYFFFAYQIHIQNNSPQSVQLTRRYWLITNGMGETQEVEGAGVVGETPTLAPGEAFTYTSACPLDTPIGTMEGHYTMITAQQNILHVPIPLFSLQHPTLCH